MSDARADILARVRAAKGGAATQQPQAFTRVGTLSPDERVALFCRRVGDYRAEVRRVADVADAVARVCAEVGVERLGVPPRLATAWRPSGPTVIEDHDLTPRELDRLHAVLTGATVAIAETGTIALTGSPADGRRALSLVPDIHVCVVEEHQIVELVPEAIALLGELVARERRPVTLISGPSATSDIELSRVEGVHGPRTLVVLVAKPAASD